MVFSAVDANLKELFQEYLAESLILYLAFVKTILATLFRAFVLSLSFLPSKPSFLHDHSTIQHSDFSSFQ